MRPGKGRIDRGGSIIGEPSFEVTSQPQGKPRVLRSSPVKTATTPGALSASLFVMPIISACACGLRKT